MNTAIRRGCRFRTTSTAYCLCRRASGMGGLRPFDTTAAARRRREAKASTAGDSFPGGRIADHGWWGRVHRRQSRNGRPPAMCWCSAGRQVLVTLRLRENRRQT
ncbi:hypothetical protein [Kibdelosporangium philippinense]|uniref:hypothetical protein n=1 Tax=Kibdelosporangium philippinense TaxID=211113 RepID=UPI003608E6EB